MPLFCFWLTCCSSLQQLCSWEVVTSTQLAGTTYAVAGDPVALQGVLTLPVFHLATSIYVLISSANKKIGDMGIC